MNFDTRNKVKAKAEEQRSICPDAYALTAQEAAMLWRFESIVYAFFDTRREFVGVEQGEAGRVAYNLNAESVSLLRKALASKRFSLPRAAAVAKRVLGGKWFSVFKVIDAASISTGFTGDSFAYTTSAQSLSQPLKRDSQPAFFEAWDKYGDSNAEAVRQALGLEEGFLYLDAWDLDRLNQVEYIAGYNTQPGAVPAVQGYIFSKGVKADSVLSSIGRRAIIESTYDEMNDERTYATLVSCGVSIRGEKKVSKRRLINIDKLRRQLLDKACQNGFNSRYVVLTLDEFQEKRKLSDRDGARDAFREAGDDLYESSIYAEWDNGLTDKIHPLDRQMDYKNSKATFKLGDTFFQTYKNNKSLTLMPEGILSIDGRKPNVYTIAVQVWDDIRRNLGKPKREGHIRVSTLLNMLELPDAEGMAQSLQQRQIITPFFAALDEAAKVADFSYNILNSAGNKLSNQEKIEIRYDLDKLSSCMLEVSLKNEPEYYAKLRQEKIDKAEAKSLEAKAKVEKDRKIVEAAAKRKKR